MTKTFNLFRLIKRWFRDFPYWLRTHTIHRYHMIDCRSPQNGYRWGWLDRDHLILFATMKILTDFVDEEKGLYLLEPTGQYDSTGYINRHNLAVTALKSAYDWWNTTRPKMLKEHGFISDEIQEIDQKMLELVIKFRGTLWI